MIETKRLIIRPLSHDELKKQIQAPDELAFELGLTPSTSLVEEEIQDAIQDSLLSNGERNSVFDTMWIVIEKTQKAMIGCICFHGEPDKKGEVEIGYGTDKEYRNKGYMTETIAGMVKWLAVNKTILAVNAETGRENRSSIKVLEKNNFRIYHENGDSVFMKLELPN